MSKTLRKRATITLQIAALVCVCVASLAGRPPSDAQGPRLIPYDASTPADQRRDDHIESIEMRIAEMKEAQAKTWEAINDNKAQINQLALDAAARTNTTTWLNGGTIAGILASIGLQIRGPRRRRKPLDREGDEEEDN